MPDGSSWFSIGHVTDETNRTGCTVIVFDELVPAVVDVRGGAPGTRETALLDAGRLVGSADAILLTGGSAFGLAAADGVMRFLSEQQRGFPTSVINVPIVPATVIFDLAEGHPVWPNADDGYHAARSATAPERASFGRVGAGTGATVAKLGGSKQPGGIGAATANVGDVSITAIVVVNAVGDIVDPSTGELLAGSNDPEHRGRRGRDLVIDRAASARSGENTSIGVVLIDGALDRDALRRCCVSAHDALARCIVPAHTVFDGDTFFAACRRDGVATAETTLQCSIAAEIAVERAITRIFDPSTSERDDHRLPN